MDWHAWHDGYDEPGTRLARRLAAVQDQIRVALDAAPPGPLHAVSLCAGQGRDLIGVLARHPRGADVTARLVELDPRNAAAARDAAAAAGLPGVEAVTADAALTDQYAGPGPGLPGAGLRDVRQRDRRRHPAHDRLLHPAVRARRHGDLDPQPAGAGSGAADLSTGSPRTASPGLGVRPGRGLGSGRAPFHGKPGPARARRAHVQVHPPAPGINFHPERAGRVPHRTTRARLGRPPGRVPAPGPPPTRRSGCAS